VELRTHHRTKVIVWVKSAITVCDSDEFDFLAEQLRGAALINQAWGKGGQFLSVN